jgi:hypothetical protein
LGSGIRDADEITAVQAAREKAGQQLVDIPRFVERAVNSALGGQAELTAEGLRVVRTPHGWVRGQVEPSYDLLLRADDTLADEADASRVLYEEHPLVQAAVGWVRSTRFDAKDDHRVAYHVAPGLAEPELVATYIVKLRDGSGREIERLAAVRVARSLVASRDREADAELLWQPSTGNVDAEQLRELFGAWWDEGLAAARGEAERRAQEWLAQTRETRRLENVKLLREHEEWDAACRAAIRGEREAALPGLAEDAPAVARKLRVHEKRARERREYLERRVRFDEPQVDPLGVLLRVPAEGGQV